MATALTACDVIVLSPFWCFLVFTSTRNQSICSEIFRKMNWNSLKCAWFISRQQTSHLFFFFCCLNTWSRARFGYCVPTSPPSPPHPPATSRSTNQALRVTDVFERVFPVAAAQRESVSVWSSKKQKRSMEFLTFAGRQVFKKKTKRCHDLLIYWFIVFCYFCS